MNLRDRLLSESSKLKVIQDFIQRILDEDEQEHSYDPFYSGDVVNETGAESRPRKKSGNDMKRPLSTRKSGKTRR